MDLGCDWSSRGSRPLPLSIPRQAVTVVGLAVKFSCRRHTEHKQINALGKFHLTESVGCIYSVRKKQFLCLKCIQKNQEVLFPQLTVKKLLSHWTICCLSLSTIDTSQRGKIWNHKTALSPRWGLPQKSPTAVFYIFKTNTFWKNYVAVTSFFESEDGSAAFLGSKKKKKGWEAVAWSHHRRAANVHTVKIVSRLYVFKRRIIFAALHFSHYIVLKIISVYFTL